MHSTVFIEKLSRLVLSAVYTHILSLQLLLLLWKHLIIINFLVYLPTQSAKCLQGNLLRLLFRRWINLDPVLVEMTRSGYDWWLYVV